VKASPLVLGPRHYGWLTLAFLGLAVYGSLVPLHFRPLPVGAALARFREVLDGPVRIESRSDWVANILLFIPLGFLLTGTLAVDRSRRAGWTTALLVLPACTVLSAAIEFTQLFFPPRVSALNDIVAESFGGLLGTAVWLTAGQRLTWCCRSLWADLGGRESAQSLLWAYLALLVLVQVVPLDLTISPGELYQKYKQGRVRLIPFADWLDNPVLGIGKCLTNMALFLPVGLFLPGLAHPFWRRRGSWLTILGLAVGFAALIEFMQLFVWTRFFNSTDIFTGSMAILIGWAVGLTWGAQLACQRAVGTALVCAYLGVLVFISWEPFNFEPSIASVTSRLADVQWVPFADYQEAEYLQAADQICSTTALFICLGAVTALGPFARFRRFSGLAAIFAGSTVGILLQAGKLVLPERHASVSDVVLATLGVGVGFAVVRHAQRRMRETHHERASVGAGRSTNFSARRVN
jgi:glycopeptide antibiotics resistance protein